ncbi:hypothetical protein [Streptomyces albidoflavus]|uniref:hypothetical protein n=1 Tax=Streptomyces albidoflavus TaxID=1886 RepID=UPI0033ED9EDF
MNDWESAMAKLLTSPLGDEINQARRWALTVTNSDRLEVFLNPQDAEGVEGCKVMGMPIRQSIGVAQGTALIFDHLSSKYIRKGEHPDWSS